MKIWLIADTHFLHDNIIGYTNRPKNHNKLIFENWNKYISKEDKVIHLGDFSAGVNKHKNGFETLVKLANNLNGEIHLIRGNHDHYSDEVYINDFGFKSVQDYIIMNDLFLVHYPLIIDEYTKERQKPFFNELINTYKDNNCKYIIHGHSHRKIYGGNRINLAVELNDYRPVQIIDLQNLLNIQNGE